MCHSHPPSAEAKNEWKYTSTPSYAFTAGTEQLYRFIHFLNHNNVFKEILMQHQNRQYLKV